VQQQYQVDSITKLFGQEHLYNTLSTWVQDPKQIPQSLLLVGPYGCGKTSIARMLAKLLVSNDRDLDEVNAASSRGIDDVRGWAESTRFSPFGSARVMIIDELHQMTTQAQSALLKVIETPPANIYFFLCTTDPMRLLPTIRSRCVPLEVKILTREAASDLVTFYTKGRLEEDVIDLLYAKSGGHARDLIHLSQIALTSGVTSAVEANNTLGLGRNDIEKSLLSLCQGYNPQVVQSLLASDENVLGLTLDTFIDASMSSPSPVKNIKDNFAEFLQIRVFKKEYKLTPREQLLHFVARVSSL
jgi:DNA polymerase III subunit gamma/tau